MDAYTNFMTLILRASLVRTRYELNDIKTLERAKSAKEMGNVIVCGICRSLDKKQISTWKEWPKKTRKCCTKIKPALVVNLLLHSCAVNLSPKVLRDRLANTVRRASALWFSRPTSLRYELSMYDLPRKFTILNSLSRQCESWRSGKRASGGHFEFF